ncbi:MAG: guanylate kinase [Acidobacteria bacterium]|nr:MAG: guanylate kinase [Acidobacteriota bacterium]REK01044.1 MAG: guanylate kinase [Acidobacteriota bacterium]
MAERVEGAEAVSSRADGAEQVEAAPADDVARSVASGEEPPTGELFIISAPSGAGKTTLIHRLLRGDMPDLAFSVSHTTRRPRADEVDGVDYHFVDRATFEASIERGEFLEWAEVHGNLYGTSLREVRPRLESGQDVLLDIDVQGGERVMAEQRDPATSTLGARVHSIFVMPPSFGELEKRLRQRNQDRREQIETRLEVSRWEMSRAEAYDYVIVNDDARYASSVLAAIIQDKRHRGERMRPRVSRILRDFQTA